jgi:hypothetical protein
MHRLREHARVRNRLPVLAKLPAQRNLLRHNHEKSHRLAALGPLDINLLNVDQESVVCSHAVRGGDWVWLA